MLEQEQINEITSFCESKGVNYYDVQLELVDHIADIIEDLQKTNTGLSFSNALDLAGKQFSHEEFKEIVKSKNTLIEKKVSNLIENEFITFFTVPKIIITISFLVFAYSFPYLVNYFGVGYFLVLFGLIFIVGYFYIQPNDKEIKAIKDACRIPLLSIKVKSRYEKLIYIVWICGYLGQLSTLFRDESHIEKIIHFSPQKILLVQSLLIFFVFFGILQIAILHVRRRLLNIIWEQYPKAFA